MSAFICSPEHFKALAIFASSRVGGYGSAHLRVDPRYVEQLDLGGKYLASCHVDQFADLNQHELATLYADVLYQENIRSVFAHYPQDKTINDLPGLIDKPDHIVVTGRDESLACYRSQVSPVAILKMCDCLEYQYCETEDGEKSLAHVLMQNIRKAAIRQLPGYEDAPWDYHISEKKAT